MTVIGFSLSRVLVERKESIKGKVEVKSKLHIKDMKKEDIKLVEGKDVLRFDFDYSINYQPDLAKVDMQGHLLLMVDPKQTKELLKGWEKNQQMPEEIKLNVYNTVFHKCNIKALELEEDLSLPPHLQLPYIKAQDKTQDKAQDKANYTG
jgi:hypothetical protein